MARIMDEIKSLASYAVFRELYNNGVNDIFDVIAEFIKEVILSNGKHYFSSSDIRELLEKNYGFDLPENVIKTSIKRIRYVTRQNKAYIVENLKDLKSSVESSQTEIINQNNKIIDDLLKFIESKLSKKLSEDEQVDVVQSFCSFLLEDTNCHKYSELISAFIIENQNNEIFAKQLSSIKEGVVLYTGLKFNNDLNDLGSWRSKLTIFLDTEILFHFAGYNGELYRTLFHEFFDLVNEINRKSHKPLITLRYFSEIKNEVESFFAKAEFIVRGLDKPNPNKTAMNSIIDGCKSPSDVIAKKTDFFRLLNKHNILEDSNADYYDPQNYKYNIEDISTIQAFTSETSIEDIEDSLKLLSKINILRRDSACKLFENAGYILLSENSRTLYLSRHCSIKEGNQVPLAVDLSFLTSKLWFKLNKGFGGRDLPKTFSAITKAQIVLSKLISESVGKKYDELIQQYKNNEIDQDTVKAYILSLRSQVRKPENIGVGDTDDILSDITEDSLEKFKKDLEYQRQKIIEQEKENQDLKQIIRENQDAIRRFWEEKVGLLNKQLDILHGYEKIYSDLNEQKKILMKKAERLYKKFKLKVIASLLIYYGFIIYLIIGLGLTVVPTILSVLQLVGSALYFIIYEKSVNIKRSIKKYLINKMKFYENKIFKEAGFNILSLEELEVKIKNIQNEIRELQNEIREHQSKL